MVAVCCEIRLVRMSALPVSFTCARGRRCSQPGRQCPPRSEDQAGLLAGQDVDEIDEIEEDAEGDAPAVRVAAIGR